MLLRVAGPLPPAHGIRLWGDAVKAGEEFSVELGLPVMHLWRRQLHETWRLGDVYHAPSSREQALRNVQSSIRDREKRELPARVANHQG